MRPCLVFFFGMMCAVKSFGSWWPSLPHKMRFVSFLSRLLLHLTTGWLSSNDQVLRSSSGASFAHRPLPASQCGVSSCSECEARFHIAFSSVPQKDLSTRSLRDNHARPSEPAVAVWCVSQYSTGGPWDNVELARRKRAPNMIKNVWPTVQAAAFTSNILPSILSNIALEWVQRKGL